MAELADLRKPYGRVCLSVISSQGEATFDPKADYDAGAALVVHLDASTPCIAVTVALDMKNGHLANGWRPQLAELAEGADVVLPRKPTVWTLASIEPFDFYVLFLDSGASDVREIKRLIQAMQNSKTDSQLLTIQTIKLRELLTRQLAGSELSSHVAAIPLPDEVGGALRSDEFPWRRFSVSVNFSQIQPGMLIFSRRAPQN